MFDPKRYQNACAQLRLGQEKWEEIITMTENTRAKKRLSRPVKTILIAAACVAALTVTAMAAPAVRQLLMPATITITSLNGEDGQVQAFTMPSLALTEQDGRSIFTVDDQDIDVTDAFSQDGQYVMAVDGATITVKPNGMVEVSMTDVNGAPLVYTFDLAEEAQWQSNAGAIRIDDQSLSDGDMGVYTVTIDENMAVVLPDAAE